MVQEQPRRRVIEIDEDSEDDDDSNLAMDIAVGFAISTPIMVVLGLVVLDNLGFALALSPMLAVGFGLARQYFRDHGSQAGT